MKVCVLSLQYFSGLELKILFIPSVQVMHRRSHSEESDRRIRCSHISVLDVSSLAGAYVGRKCSASPEAAGAAAQRGRPTTQRNC